MKPKNDTTTDQPAPKTRVLLRRIAPCDEAAKLFEDPKKFIGDLVAFVSEGLRQEEGVVVVATMQHLRELEQQLRARGTDVFALTVHEQYMRLSCEDMLNRFMVKGWPDESLFRHLTTSLASKVIKPEQNLRIFSEMAAHLWLQGYRAAAVKLELIWAKLVESAPDYNFVELVTEIIPPSPQGAMSDSPVSFLRY